MLHTSASWGCLYVHASPLSAPCLLCCMAPINQLRICVAPGQDSLWTSGQAWSQVVNVICWIGPNAYLISVPCRWNGWNDEVLDAFGILRFSCWNSHFLIFLVQVWSALVEP